MAYGVRIEQKCQGTRCPRTAKVRVYTTGTDGGVAIVGVFCETCADRKISELNIIEARQHALREAEKRIDP
jgi:hypothetical protein